jgi:hypothetical protein
MKHGSDSLCSKWYVLIGVVFFSCQLSYAFRGYKTFVSPRSQGCDAARELVGWQETINKSDPGYNYFSFSITPVYGQVFKNKQIVKSLIGCSDTVAFSGSRYPLRDKDDILADNFGLPSDFKSAIKFCPSINNFVMDFNFFWGLDELHDGLFMRLHMPIVHSKWDLNMCETVCTTGTAFYPAGYMGPERINRNKLAEDVEMALRGTTTFGDMDEVLQYGTVFGHDRDTHIADFRFELGYNVLRDQDYHLGFAVLVAAPTGTRPCAQYLFEPIVGNGKHWELGLGITSHIDFDDKHCWALYADANLTHLFGSCQKRSYDFKCNGSGSRYMLLAEVLPPSQNLFFDAAGTLAAPNQYTGRLLPAINKTTLDSTIKVNIQADIAVKLSYHHDDNLSFDFGYSLWARSAEKLVCRQAFESNHFVLKGDSQVYGFPGADTPAVRLNPSQHCATLLAGQGVTNFVAGQEFINANVDNLVLARQPAQLFQLNTADAGSLGIVRASVSTSHDPVLLTDCAIDNSSALAAKALSHKFFGHVSRLWEGETFSPYLGCGGEIELAGCDVKNNSALSQWGVWVKGGIAY